VSSAPDLSLVLPFYNEEKNVEWVLEEMTGSFRGAGFSFELIAVDNGSFDRTAELIDRMISRDPGAIRKVTVPVNQGYGHGILAGLRSARGTYVGYSPGDGQVPAGDIASVFLKARELDLDFVQGRRIRKDTPLRRLNTRFYNFIFHFFFRCPVYDVGSNPKILRKSWYEKMNLVSRDWFLDGEIILKTHLAGGRMREFPVEFRKREEGRSKINMAAALQMLKNVLRWKLKTVRGR